MHIAVQPWLVFLEVNRAEYVLASACIVLRNTSHKKKRGVTLIIVGVVSQSTFQVGSLLSVSTVMSPGAAVQKENLCWPHLEDGNMVCLLII